MKTSNNWFNEGPRETWEKHLLPIADQITNYLEIGVNEGASMKWVIDNLQSSYCLGIDPYIAPKGSKQDQFDQYKVNCMDNLGLSYAALTRDIGGLVSSDDPLIRVILDKSWLAFHDPDLKQYISRCDYDLAYVDGSHWGSDCLDDMIHVWKLLKPCTRVPGQRKRLRDGGIMIVDDLHRRFHRGRASVRMAVEAFRLAYDGLWEVEWEYPRQVAFRRMK